MRRRELLWFGLIVAHVVLPLALIFAPGTHTAEFEHTSDAARYRAIATNAGRPYADFDVEYPPVAVALFEALPSNSFGSFVDALIVFQALCDAALAFALFWGWGIGAAQRYLLFVLPLLPVLLTKYDLLPAALAVGGMALVVRRRPILGGVALAAAVLAKLWAAALVPVLVVRRQWRAAFTAAIASVVGALAWVAYGGIDGVSQVLTFRHARGWHAESMPGVILGIVTGDPMRFEQGSWRIGDPPAAATAALGGALVALLVALAWYGWRSRGGEPGVIESGAAAAVLVCAPLLSPQYIVWLLPWIAIAGAFGVRRVQTAGLVVLGLTLVYYALGQASDAERADMRIVFLLRGGALLWVVVQAISSMRSSATRAHSAVSASTTI